VNLTWFGPNSGFWYCVFADFMENSNILEIVLNGFWDFFTMVPIVGVGSPKAHFLYNNSSHFFFASHHSTRHSFIPSFQSICLVFFLVSQGSWLKVMIL
jgi:hypothetical protein